MDDEREQGKRFTTNPIPGSNGCWWEVRDRLFDGSPGIVASFSSDDHPRNRRDARNHAYRLNRDLPSA